MSFRRQRSGLAKLTIEKVFSGFAMSPSQISKLSVVVVAVISGVCQATVYHGRVDRVVDGDTLIVTTESDQLRVRIRGIDAPEKDQPYGTEARKALNAMVIGRSVMLITDGKDKYGRVLASVATGETDIGLQLLEKGLAWAYTGILGTEMPAQWKQAYKTAEAEARIAGIGLWTTDGPVPPWSWRKQRKEASAAEDELQQESLEGITEELSDNTRILTEKFSDAKERLISGDEDSSSGKTTDSNKDASWWELFINLGEGASRWLKAFFLSLWS